MNQNSRLQLFFWNFPGTRNEKIAQRNNSKTFGVLMMMWWRMYNMYEIMESIVELRNLSDRKFKNKINLNFNHLINPHS